MTLASELVKVLEMSGQEYTGDLTELKKITKNIRIFNGNWVEGEIDGFTFTAKIFQEPSHYGIQGGRISALELKDDKGEKELNYSRGWDIQPKDEKAKAALKKILAAVDGTDDISKE